MWPPTKAELTQLWNDGAELQTIADIYRGERSMVFDLAEYYGLEMMTKTERKHARERMWSEGRDFPTAASLSEFREKIIIEHGTPEERERASRLREKERKRKREARLERESRIKESALILQQRKERKEARLDEKLELHLQRMFETNRHKRRFTLEESRRFITESEVKHWSEQGWMGDDIIYETGIERKRLVEAFRRYGYETIEAFPGTMSLSDFKEKQRKRNNAFYDIPAIREKAKEGYALWRIAHHFGYQETKLARVVEEERIEVGSIEDDPFRHEIREFFEGRKVFIHEACHHFRLGSKRMVKLMKTYHVMSLRNQRKVYSKERPPKKLLEQLYIDQKMTRVQIGRQLNVSVNDLTEWFDEYDMPTQKRGRDEPTREELYEMYFIKEMSRAAICRHFNRSSCWVQARLDKYEFRRERYTRKNPPPRELLYDLYTKRGLSQAKAAQIIGISETLLGKVLTDYKIEKGNPRDA